MSPPPSQATSPTGLRGVLRRRMPVVLVGTLVGVALGFVVATTIEPATPAASVGVEVLPTGVDLAQPSSGDTRDLAIDRAVIRVTSPEVLTAAAAEFDAPLTPTELGQRVEARQRDDTPLVELTVTHPDQSVAVAAADGIARAYLALEASAAVAARDQRIAALQAALDETNAEIGAFAAQLASTEDTTRAAALESLRDAALRRTTELQRSLSEAQALNVDPGRIAQPARPEPTDQRPGEAVAVPAAGALGLLLGLLGALVADRVDRRVWEQQDVTAATGSAPVVRTPRDDLVGDGLRTGAGHRRLRALVAPALFTSGSVLVSGASADHGAGIAAGLAVAVAASGRRTLLLDASGADAFELPPCDLDGWLRGRTGLERAAQSPHGVSSLQVLTGTPDVELSSSATLRELLASPHAVVIVHAPGGSESGDALALAELVDHLVVVAAARRDRDEGVARTHRWLTRVAGREPVVVLAG